jgi:hypothetical protein
MSRKAIPRGALAVDVYHKDLLTAAQAEAQGPKMNDEQNVAGVRLPLSVWVGRFRDGVLEGVVNECWC